MGDVLDQTVCTGCQRLTGRGDDFKVHGERRLWRERADLPSGSLTDTDLGLTDTRRLLVGGNDVTNHTGDFEFFGSHDFECTVEAHLQIPSLVLGKASEETLPEDCGGKGIRDDHESVGGVRQVLHFEETDLIQTTSVDVDSVTVGAGSLR